MSESITDTWEGNRKELRSKRQPADGKRKPVYQFQGAAYNYEKAQFKNETNKEALTMLKNVQFKNKEQKQLQLCL